MCVGGGGQIERFYMKGDQGRKSIYFMHYSKCYLELDLENFMDKIFNLVLLLLIIFIVFNLCLTELLLYT